MPKWLIENRSLDALGKDKKIQEHRPVVWQPPVLVSMSDARPGLRFEKLGKKDPRIGLYLLGHAGASREFRGRAFEEFKRAG